MEITKSMHLYGCICVLKYKIVLFSSFDAIKNNEIDLKANKYILYAKR